jgi:hypothetical protein
MGWLRRLICAIRGHEDYLHFKPNRLSLLCADCGYESPGWTVEGRRSAIVDRPAIVHRPSTGPALSTLDHRLTTIDRAA